MNVYDEEQLSGKASEKLRLINPKDFRKTIKLPGNVTERLAGMVETIWKVLIMTLAFFM